MSILRPISIASVVDEALAEIVEAVTSGGFKPSSNATGDTALVVIRLPDAIQVAKVAEGKKPARRSRAKRSSAVLD